MKILKAIKKYLFGEGFEVGETVHWENRYHSQFTGEYIVMEKRDKRGYVSIFNDKMYHRKVMWYELKPIIKD